jgi:hypothetical protein
MTQNRIFSLDPIDLPRGRQLVTLQNAADYILKLLKAERKLEEWQTATEALIMARGRSRAVDACENWRATSGNLATTT